MRFHREIHGQRQQGAQVQAVRCRRSGLQEWHHYMGTIKGPLQRTVGGRSVQILSKLSMLSMLRTSGRKGDRICAR